jgi:transglutaminase-like putative cysteine protease
MILEVQHETRLTYSAPVTEAITEVRMEPVSDADQSCRSFHLAFTPAASPAHYQDGFGNRVHHFNLLGPLGEVRILAASVVETHPRSRDLGSSRAIYPIDPAQAEVGLIDFLQLRGPVHASPLLGPLLDVLRPRQGMHLAEVVLNVARHIHQHFQYAPSATLASSPVDDVLRQGKGVCQDFTHLMLAVLRSFGVPARYVSGYVHRQDKGSQSHAWCEAWLPDLGWCGIDPTNDTLANDHFVKVAVGRDFTDVPPNKGIYRGSSEESISVRVETRPLQSLPSLSWQEQLPPLQTPLTAIVRPHRTVSVIDEDFSHQQHQQ